MRRPLWALYFMCRGAVILPRGMRNDGIRAIQPFPYSRRAP